MQNCVVTGMDNELLALGRLSSNLEVNLQMIIEFSSDRLADNPTLKFGMKRFGI